MTNADWFLEQVALLRKEPRYFQKVEVELNLGCNRRCPYCFLATERREDVVETPTRVMPTDLLALLLEQLRSLDFAGEINPHFYAEPLLNKRLASQIGTIKDYLPACKIVLYTNGDLLSGERYRALRLAGVDHFHVTFHDDVVPAPCRELVGIPDVSVERRSDLILNNRAGYLGCTHGAALRSFPCIYPAVAVIVTIEGNVLPCSCDFYERVCFGNIRRAHLRDIWESEPARLFRRDLLDGRRAKYDLCRDCDFYGDNLGHVSAAEAHRDGRRAGVARGPAPARPPLAPTDEEHRGG
jgi:radical SAM protein with 4Fe4S-binding SPASM domain